MDGFLDGLNRVIPVCDNSRNINAKHKMPKGLYQFIKNRSASIETDAGCPTQNIKVLCGWWIGLIHYRYIDGENYQKLQCTGNMYEFKVYSQIST